MKNYTGYRGSIKGKAKLLNSCVFRMREISMQIGLWMETNNIILPKSYLILLSNSFLDHLLHNNFVVLVRLFLVFRVKYYCNKTKSIHFYYVNNTR